MGCNLNSKAKTVVKINTLAYSNRERERERKKMFDKHAHRT